LEQRFDLVCLFDVLEHIEDDGRALRALAALLRPGGRIMITVPANQWMWSPHDEHVHHKRRYDTGLLSATCEDARMALTRVTYFNTLLFPLAVLARWADKLGGGRSSGAVKMPAAPVNIVLQQVFGWERHLLKRLSLPFGLSLLAIVEARA
jgi:SAM-dependent methyltransferase